MSSPGTVIEGFETDDPSMVFATHIINSWEEGEEVVFDVSTNPWDSLLTGGNLSLILDHPETDDVVGPSVMKRVRLNINSRKTTVEDWPNESDLPMMNTLDFPCMNQNYMGQKNRYVYGWVSIDTWRMTLVKKDLFDSSNYKTWFTESHYPGEMFFVPNPEGTEEDDGILITISFDGEREESYVLLLDGSTFEEIDRAYLPVKIPFSFHGNWFPELH